VIDIIGWSGLWSQAFENKSDFLSKNRYTEKI